MHIFEIIAILALTLYALKLRKDVDDLYGLTKRLASIVKDHITRDRINSMNLWSTYDALIRELTGLADDFLKLREDVNNLTSSRYPYLTEEHK